MYINTKYNIGDRIWVVYESSIWTEHFKGPAGEVSVYSSKIIDILLPESGRIEYGIEAEGADTILEEDIILYDDLDLLVKKIKELDNKIRAREESDER